MEKKYFYWTSIYIVKLILVKSKFNGLVIYILKHLSVNEVTINLNEK